MGEDNELIKAAPEVKLEEAQSDVVEMAHTALGHMVALKKKELLLAAREISQEEFDQLVAARSEATKSGRIGGGGVGAGEHVGGTDDNGSSIIEGECGAANRLRLCQRGKRMRCRGLIYTIKCYL